MIQKKKKEKEREREFAVFLNHFQVRLSKYDTLLEIDVIKKMLKL